MGLGLKTLLDGQVSGFLPSVVEFVLKSGGLLEDGLIYSYQNFICISIQMNWTNFCKKVDQESRSSQVMNGVYIIGDEYHRC